METSGSATLNTSVDAPFAGQKVLLGVTGGIAAYKSPDIVRRLKERGADVQVVQTKGAEAFITALSLQAVSGRSVRTSLLDTAAEAAMGHIELARWADQILIAPASADFMARLAAGMADDLLTTLCLATDRPISIAPAMNRLMWSNPATQSNLCTLESRGVSVFGPGEGEQACGDVGAGRMLEPLDIVGLLAKAVNKPVDARLGQLSGKQVLITAGPTREPIDPVRYITNRSSGKMGFAVAAAAIAAGADVTIVAGPVKWHEARQFAVYDQCRQMNGAARIELLERGQDEPVFAKRIGRGCGRSKTAPRLHELRRYADFPGPHEKPVGTNGA